MRNMTESEITTEVLQRLETAANPRIKQIPDQSPHPSACVCARGRID